jgi:DNA-binding beta-propeller fold protein YncE
MAVMLAVLGSGCGTASAPRVGEPASAATLTVTPSGRLVSVGTKPEGIAIDSAHGLIAVAVRSPASVVILDRQGAVVRRIDLPSAARHLRFAAGSGLLLVPAEQSQQLIQIDVQAGKITTIAAVGRQPHDAVAVGSRVFVSNEFSDTVSVVEGERVVGSSTAPKQPGGIAESDGVIAVVGVRSHTLSLVDSGSLATVATVPAGQGPTHVVGSPGGRFFVADTVGNALLTFAAAPAPHLVSRLAIAGTPYGLALDTVHNRLFVSLTARNQVVEYDVGGDIPVESGRFPTPREPNSVTVDAVTGTVFVTGTADGVVQIVSSLT